MKEGLCVFISERQIGAVTQAFKENFITRNELGASLSIWYQGEEIVNLAEGWNEKEKLNSWTSETLIPVYSATKGPAAATLLMLLEKYSLTPADKVKELWAGFPIPEASFSDILSHSKSLFLILRLLLKPLNNKILIGHLNLHTVITPEHSDFC